MTGISTKCKITGWYLPNNYPLAIMKARACRMLPVAQVKVTQLGGLFYLSEKDPHIEKCLDMMEHSHS